MWPPRGGYATIQRLSLAERAFDRGTREDLLIERLRGANDMAAA
jgi:hypothetical protein